MLSVRLSATRTVELVSLHIRPFHAKHLGADPRPVQDQVADVAQAAFGNGSDPTRTPVWVGPHDGWDDKLCIGLFQSSPVAGDSLDYSLLIVGWTVRNISGPLRDVALKGLVGLRWEDHAKDFPVWT